MGPLVKELEDAGYLQREADASDRRAVLVKLSPQGEQLLRDVREAIGDIEARYAQVVGGAEMQAVEALALFTRCAATKIPTLA